jgi:hypothetical protein
VKTSAKTPILLIALIISLDFVLAGRVVADGIYHYIYGNVLDSVGNPVVGLDIVGDDFVGDVFPTVTTDDSGYYIFDAGIEGNYRVTLSCDQLTAQGFQCLDPVNKTVSGEYNELDFTVSVAVSALPLQIATAPLPNGNVTMPYSAATGQQFTQPAGGLVADFRRSHFRHADDKQPVCFQSAGDGCEFRRHEQSAFHHRQSPARAAHARLADKPVYDAALRRSQPELHDPNLHQLEFQQLDFAFLYQQSRCQFLHSD